MQSRGFGSRGYQVIRKRLCFGDGLSHFLCDDFLGVTSSKILNVLALDVLKHQEFLHLLIGRLGVKVREEYNRFIWRFRDLVGGEGRCHALLASDLPLKLQVRFIEPVDVFFIYLLIRLRLVLAYSHEMSISA